jgi:hypothetical protein
MAVRGKRGPAANWRALSKFRSTLLKHFRADGVDHVEFVVGFVEPFNFWVWLGTDTDAQRDDLSSPDLPARVTAVAEQQGLAALLEGFSVESQESLDREFEGSWFYRLR